MRHRWLVGLSVLAIGISGCLSDDVDRYGRAKKTPIPPADKLPNGSLEAASRVDTIGRQIRSANSEITVRPFFLTVGIQPLGLFHRGTTDISVSEGLVKRCQTDGELAAVLCSELAKMMVEAQAQGMAKPLPERDRPYTPSYDRNGDPDRTQLAEQALFEKQNPRRRPVDAPPEQDPKVLARGYLKKAGFSADDLEKVAALIRQAEANPAFSQMMANPRQTGGLGIPRTP